MDNQMKGVSVTAERPLDGAGLDHSSDEQTLRPLYIVRKGPVGVPLISSLPRRNVRLDGTYSLTGTN